MLAAGLALKASAELTCRLSIMVQFALSCLKVVFTIAMMPARTDMQGLVFSAAVVLVHLFNYFAIYRSVKSDNGYPWRLLRWSFPLAALVFYAPTLIQLGQRPQRFQNATSLLLLTVVLLPGILQTILLWRAHRAHMSAAEALAG